MLFEVFSIGSLSVHGYGLMIGIGIIIAIIMGCIRAKRRGLKEGWIIDLAIIAVVVGFIGGKLLYIIVEYKDFANNPLGALTSSGFVVYGGIILASIACFLYCKLVRKTSFFAYFDIVVPSLAIAQAIGRLGCLCAGCCYGKVTDSPIGIVFPEGCMAPAGVPLIPTQIMMAVGDAVICLVLIIFANRTKYRGFTGALYLMLYGAGRFAVEFFRDDYRGEIGPFSTSQFISIAIIIFSIAVFIYCYKKKMPSVRVKQNNTGEDYNK